VRAHIDAAHRERKVLEELPSYVVVCDREARILYINRTAPGFDRDAVLGTSAVEHLTPVDRSAFLRSLADVFRTGLPCELEVTDVHGRPYASRLVPLAADGTVRSVMTVASDATELRTLRETQDRYRLLFENVPIPIVGFDASTLDIREANRAALELLGYTRAELACRSIADVVLPEDAPALRKVLLGADPAPRNIGVWRNRRKDGTTFYAEVSTHGYTLLGQTHGLVMLDDVTERMRSDQERERLEEHLRQARKIEALGLLAGGVAHDFNNLLMPILGYAARVAEDPEAPDRVREDVERIRAAANQARDLVRQLLAFGRERTLRTRELDLSWEVRRFETMMRRLLTDRIELSIQAASDLPAIEADPSQIQQVLMNLVLNARAAMPDGGRIDVETATIELGAREAQALGLTEGRHVVLSVRDTGHGIDPDVLPHIFQPFFTTRQREGGTGLGLAAVHGIVQQHRGTIRVDSAPHRGARFDVVLPAMARAVDVPRRRGPTPVGTGETILLVEDEAVVRDLLCDALVTEGYRVLAAGHPDEALRLAAASPEGIHLLVTDIALPGMSGRELRRRLDRSVPGVPALFISGYAGDDPSGRIEGEDVHLLEKPFPPHRLAEKVRELLDG
jgi:PAS domain S-box-containing protein